ncbi:hypothetical protein L7F22_041080 [Adiantum nelumboides]|nr:hypothetical protein [Adiantum nelumboides]
MAAFPPKACTLPCGRLPSLHYCNPNCCSVAMPHHQSIDTAICTCHHIAPAVSLAVISVRSFLPCDCHIVIDEDLFMAKVHLLSTEDDPPYRMAVHPTGHGIVCSFTQSCRLFEMVRTNGSEPDNMKLEPANKALTQLQEVGQQRSLVFSADGTRFAAGGDDGHLRVFEWPSLRLILDQPEAHRSIRDVDFSLDSAFLASTGGSGPCRIWDLSTMATVASLSLDQARDLGFCRFSRDGTNPLLFVAVKEGEKGSIAVWNTNNWRKVGVKKFQESPISAFAMSYDGKYLAIGSSEGDVSIVSVAKMTVHQRVKRAHMIFVTSMEFSRDCRALLSVSADSSARVTVIEEVKQEVDSHTGQRQQQLGERTHIDWAVWDAGPAGSYGTWCRERLLPVDTLAEHYHIVRGTRQRVLEIESAIPDGWDQPRYPIAEDLEKEKIQFVKDFLEDMNDMLKAIRESFRSAQNCVKTYASKGRKKVTFDKRDFVFLKVSTKSKTMKTGKCDKLSLRYCGLFKILKKVGDIAYKLKLQKSSEVYPVFHVSKLKKSIHGLKHVVSPDVLVELIEPSKIHHMNRKGLSYFDKSIHVTVDQEILVKWIDTEEEDATWERRSVISKRFLHIVP